jgi:hypothetical protein
MNQRSLFTASLLFCVFTCFAQEETDTYDDRKGKFKQERIFLGSGINFGISSTSYNIGLNPEIGYSINKWLDGGINVNFNYFSQNASDYSPIRFQDFNYGVGSFLRIWPVNFLHIQVQPEYNWTNSHQKDVITQQSGTFKSSAESLLIGVGYGSRNIGGGYSYVTLMIDVLQNVNSPYRDQYNDPLPVFRAGFGIYLKPKRR